MSFIDLIHAFILGIVEGVTEFVPVSSTGHLILVGHWLGFTGPRAESFEIVIQLGAILAVMWVYRQTLLDVAVGWRRDIAAQRFIVNLVVAFIPAAVVGLLIHDWIKAHLFSPVTVAWALIVGGIAMLIIERVHPPTRIAELKEMRGRTALAIGLAQVLSLFPGVSRSGATIMGGLAFGLSRKAATEFSFFLAMPVMLAATVFDLADSAKDFTKADAAMFGVGLATAFLSALLVVRLFLQYVARRSFVPFAWYRIVVGVVVLLVLGRSAG